MGQDTATATNPDTASDGIDIAAWIEDNLYGSGGLEDYEDHEIVIWHINERSVPAHWILRCLANPRNEGSAEVLQAIINRRLKVKREMEAHPR